MLGALGLLLPGLSRIRTELTDATSGLIIRSDRHEGLLAEAFDLMADIALRAMKTIAPNVLEVNAVRSET